MTGITKRQRNREAPRQPAHHSKTSEAMLREYPRIGCDESALSRLAVTRAP